MIMEKWYQSRALYDGVIKLLKDKQFKTALDIANAIPDKGIKAKALSKITIEMAKASHKGYKETLQKTLDAIFEMNSEESITKALMSLAFELIALNRLDDALQIANFIHDISNRSKVQAEIAIVLAKQRKVSEALAIIEKIVDTDVKTWATSRLAAELTQGKGM